MLSMIIWSGSKRYQANYIVNKFPSEIDTYYEPFIGSGAVMLEMLQRIDVDVNHCEASDICKPLIHLWNTVKTNPDSIILEFEKLYTKYVNTPDDQRKAYFNEIRKEFNDNQELAAHFLFLTRYSLNGLIRFNKSGKYNSTFQYRPKGLNPEKLQEIVLYTNKLIQKVDFYHRGYDQINPSFNDLVYMDPPYMMKAGNTMYMDKMDFNKYFNFVNNLKCKWLVSFNGKINSKVNNQVQNDVTLEYKNLYYAPKKKASFFAISYEGDTVTVQDSLYTNF